jgi:hypothetical protein
LQGHEDGSFTAERSFPPCSWNGWYCDTHSFHQLHFTVQELNLWNGPYFTCEMYANWLVV